MTKVTGHGLQREGAGARGQVQPADQMQLRLCVRTSWGKTTKTALYISRFEIFALEVSRRVCACVCFLCT